MSAAVPIPSGVWEHRSGQRYLVLGTGRLDDDDDRVVVYVRLYGRPDGGPPLSVRRASDFLANVQGNDGATIPRFRFLGEIEPGRD
jgi:hypothetical protein